MTTESCAASECGSEGMTDVILYAVSLFDKIAAFTLIAVPFLGAVFFRTNVVQIWSPIFLTGKTMLSAFAAGGMVVSAAAGADRSRRRIIVLPKLSLMAIGADAAASGLVKFTSKQ